MCMFNLSLTLNFLSQKWQACGRSTTTELTSTKWWWEWKSCCDLFPNCSYVTVIMSALVEDDDNNFVPSLWTTSKFMCWSLMLLTVVVRLIDTELLFWWYGLVFRFFSPDNPPIIPWTIEPCLHNSSLRENAMLQNSQLYGFIGVCTDWICRSNLSFCLNSLLHWVHGKGLLDMWTPLMWTLRRSALVDLEQNQKVHRCSTITLETLKHTLNSGSKEGISNALLST